MIRSALILAAFLIACGPIKRTPTYVAQVDYTFAQPAAEGWLGPEAQTALAAARSVAFFPPDDCPKDGCGAFMSRLERAAMSFGFRVISWQSLRGPERTIEYARQQGVDVLFQVNVLRFGVPPSDLYSRVDASFVDAASGRSLSVRGAAAVARRCIPGTTPALRPDLALVLDIKMSSVADGEVLWTHRTTQSGLPAGRTLSVSMPYKATSSWRLKGVSQWKIGLGIASVVVSATAALATILIDGTSGDKIDFPKPLYLAEALLAGTGIYMLATAHSKAHWGYSTPDETLCVPARLAGPTALPTADRAPGATCAESCRKRRRLMDRVARAVLGRVDALRKGAPAKTGAGR